MYDFHTHFIPVEVMEWLRENKNFINSKRVRKDPTKKEFLIINEKWGFELKDEFVDEKLYLKEQENAGVTYSIISPIPQLFMYDFEVNITSDLSKTYNQALIELTRKNPTKIAALGTIPLNHPTNAAKILEQGMQNGLKGVIIGPGIQGHMLSDEFFTPVFEVANQYHSIIFVHPLLCEDPRLKRRMMPNLIGVPWETTICATDLLLSGLIDKYPNLKIIFAHGGGFMPYQIGRLDKGYEMWEPVSAKLNAPPSDYLKRFWYDSVLWNQESLAFLEKMVGTDQIVPGSDFPFDLSVWPPETKFTKSVEKILG